jgi:hypothetical protein
LQMGLAAELHGLLRVRVKAMGELRFGAAKVESSDARHADIASFAVPEHHRNGLVSPTSKLAISASKSGHRVVAGEKE